MTFGERREPLRRGKPLARGKGLAPGRPLQRGRELRRGAPLARGGPIVPKPRTAGDNPDAKGAPLPVEMRELARVRDGGQCQRCGTYCLGGRHSVHHRQPRQSGGSVGAHYPANLVLLCGDATSPGCHSLTESRRSEAYELGWLVRRGSDPRAVPVFRFGRRWEQPGELWVPAEQPAA